MRNEDDSGRGSSTDREDLPDANGADGFAGDAAIARVNSVERGRRLRSQQDMQICQLQQRLRKISAKQLSSSNNICGRDSVANTHVIDPFVSAGYIASIAGGNSFMNIVEHDESYRFA